MLLLARGPYRGLAILFAITPFGMMAAFNLPALGGLSILATDMVVMTFVALTLLRRDVGRDIATTLTRGSLALPLLALLLYAALATLYFPRVFAGATEVFSLSRDANAHGIVRVPLRPDTGNLAQLLRMSLVMAAFLCVAILVQRRPDPRALLTAMKIATGVHVGLGVIDILTNAAGLTALLEPIRTANYALTLGHRMAGLTRMIGGFPEASAFGYYSVGFLGFWLSYWLSERGDTTARTGGWSTGIWLALSAFVVVRSTSSSAYVGAAGFLLVFALIQMRGGTIRLNRATGWIVLLILASLPLVVIGGYAAYALVPGIGEFIDRSLLEKMATKSGVERMSWNAQALVNFLDTNMLGTGLGAVRGSNWLISTLATLGLPGTLLYLLFLWRLFTAPTGGLSPATARLVTAFKMGCLAFLMRALVVHGSANLLDLFFISAGAVQGLVLAAARAPVVRPGLPPGPRGAADTRAMLRSRGA